MLLLLSGVVGDELERSWRLLLSAKGGGELEDACKFAHGDIIFNKSVYVVYTVLGDVQIYVVGKDGSDELALTEVIFVLTGSIKDVCKRPPSERVFLDKYGKICLCIDEIVWKGILENTDKDRILEAC